MGHLAVNHAESLRQRAIILNIKCGESSQACNANILEQWHKTLDVHTQRERRVPLKYRCLRSGIQSTVNEYFPPKMLVWYICVSCYAEAMLNHFHMAKHFEHSGARAGTIHVTVRTEIDVSIIKKRNKSILAWRKSSSISASQLSCTQLVNHMKDGVT